MVLKSKKEKEEEGKAKARRSGGSQTLSLLAVVGRKHPYTPDAADPLTPPRSLTLYCQFIALQTGDNAPFLHITILDH